MGSCSGVESDRLEIFEVGPCKNAYELGLLIGQRFSKLIKSRVARDLILQNQLRPFAHTTTPQSESLLKSLFDNNREKFPRYWDELLGTAQGSGVPLLDVIYKSKPYLYNLTCCYLFFDQQKQMLLHKVIATMLISGFFVGEQILLINFRKEILAFIPKEGAKSSDVDTLDDCSDVLVVGESMAIAAHNEDANVALVGHT